MWWNSLLPCDFKYFLCPDFSRVQFLSFFLPIWEEAYIVPTSRWTSTNNTMVNNLNCKCSGGETLFGDGVDRGEWNEWSSTCDKGICALHRLEWRMGHQNQKARVFTTQYSLAVTNSCVIGVKDKRFIIWIIFYPHYNFSSLTCDSLMSEKYASNSL